LSPTLVVDACVGCKWLLPEDGSDDARRLLAAWTAGRVVAMAPDVYPVEVANVIWKKHALMDQITVTEAEAALSELYATLPRLASSQPFVAHAWHLSAAMQTPVHDTLYLALALAYAPATLVTEDRRLERRAERLFPGVVRKLGDVVKEIVATSETVEEE
jgi:predicted nucleic acid-binding protein